MNQTYLEKAKERMPNIPLLINVISKRVRQLNAGQRPLVKPDSGHMSAMDLALKEIAEGKMSSESAFTTAEETTDSVITL